MKTVATMGAQGDCLFRRISRLPDKAKEQPLRGRAVVAHSETGHHHSIDDVSGVRFFSEPTNPLVCYLMLEGVEFADVVHHRPFHTHETLRLLATRGEPTVFEVRRQREYRSEPDRAPTGASPAHAPSTARHSWTPVRD